MKSILLLALAAVTPVAVIVPARSPTDALIAVVIGCIGVALARAVFVSRTKRETGQNADWRETLPLTLAGMLSTGAIVWDQAMSISSAAILGLGTGWVAVLMLDLVGGRALDVVRAIFGIKAKDEE